MSGWIGVDLDGTLAHYAPGSFVSGDIGPPVEEMLVRVKAWLGEGKEIRIFTARACSPELIPSIEAWCEKHLGTKLKVTNVKDFAMIELWDDRAVQVVMNKGVPVGYSTRGNK